MEIHDLSYLAPDEQSVLYAALLSHVKKGDGYGLMNCDAGHPAYSIGAQDASTDMGDSPENSTLFKAMRTLSRVAFEYGEFASEDLVYDWQSYCALVARHAKRG